MITPEQILGPLNEDQRQAVINYEGPSIILAGPGSGKTSTVVARTQYMISIGEIDPHKILLFTFTNKAAKEIKNRVTSTIGKDGEFITVGTYHSICCRILRKYAQRIGFERSFTIFDSDDSSSLIKRLIKTLDLSVKPVTVKEYISTQKSKMISYSKSILNAETTVDKTLADLYQRYQDELYQQNAMDFDDLISAALRLFEMCPDVLAEINERYQYIIADESHDSAPRDLRLIEILGGNKQNVCMILDDDQSIYSFRGVELPAILNMVNIFTNTRTFILQRNYRSTQTIVEASRSLIAKNTRMIEKTIFTENSKGTPIIFYEEPNQQKEAERVIQLIKYTKAKKNFKYEDFAILYRTSAQSRSLESEFLHNSIPYKIVGGLPFYSRKEIKDLLCYMRFIVNPYDYEAFKRIITVPTRGIAEATMNKILAYSRDHYSDNVDLITAINEIDLKGKTGESVKIFAEQVNRLVSQIESSAPSEFIKILIKEINYYAYLAEYAPDLYADKLENIMELQNLASFYDSVDEFIQVTCLDSQINDNDEDSDCVNFITMHASKGLEYKCIIIVDVYEGANPHIRADTSKAVEEERRLFYVAMTRAKEFLFFIRPRYIFNQGRTMVTELSRFVKEIDQQYIQKCK